MGKVIQMKVSKAYEQVFGNANLNAPKKDGKVPMRLGKTKRDKANGVIAGKKNRRIFDDKAHKWVKV